MYLLWFHTSPSSTSSNCFLSPFFCVPLETLLLVPACFPLSLLPSWIMYFLIFSRTGTHFRWLCCCSSHLLTPYIFLRVGFWILVISPPFHLAHGTQHGEGYGDVLSTFSAVQFLLLVPIAGRTIAGQTCGWGFVKEKGQPLLRPSSCWRELCGFHGLSIRPAPTPASGPSLQQLAEGGEEYHPMLIVMRSSECILYF